MVTIEAQRQKIGKQLYVAAWIVEVLAASLGLALAVIMLLAARQELLQNNNAFSSGDTFKIYLAGLPFLAIAVVELLKIPFAAACYLSTTKLTKIIFGFCLFLISILTFETFFFGLEQNSSVRLMAINQIKDEKFLNEKLTKDLEERANQLRSRGTKADIERENKKALGIINTEEEEEIKRIEKLIKEFQAPVDLAKNKLTTDIKDKREEINDKKSFIRGLEKQLRDIQNRSVINVKEEKLITNTRKTRKENAEADFTSDKETAKQSLNLANNNINELELAKNKECKWYSSNNCAPIKKRLNEQIKIKTGLEEKLRNMSLASNIKRINKDYDQDIEKSRENELDQKKKDEKFWKGKIEKENQELSELETNHQDLISKLQNFDQTEVFQIAQKKKDKLKAEKEEKRNIYGQKRRDQKLKRNKLIAEDNDKENNLRENEKKRNELKDKITKLENKFDREARGNQFYRFAMIFMRIKSPSKVTNEHLSLIVKVWFISLAGIIAWMGTLLAFASFVVRYGPSSSEAKIAKAAAKAEKAAAKAARAAAKAANAKSSKLRRCLRLLFIEARKYIRQPKFKEIEKVVEKIVEVEKEIVVEKIVPTEVIKEVPVDRVVIQNVPTEVIRKEVIHVPIASDDLTILDVKKIKPATKGQKEDLSKENPEKGEK